MINSITDAFTTLWNTLEKSNTFELLKRDLYIDLIMIPYIQRSFRNYYKTAFVTYTDKKIEDIDYEIEYHLNCIEDWGIADGELKIYNEEAYNYALNHTKKELYENLINFKEKYEKIFGEKLRYNYTYTHLLECVLVRKSLLHYLLTGDKIIYGEYRSDETISFKESGSINR